MASTERSFRTLLVTPRIQRSSGPRPSPVGRSRVEEMFFANDNFTSICRHLQAAGEACDPGRVIQQMQVLAAQIEPNDYGCVDMQDFMGRVQDLNQIVVTTLKDEEIIDNQERRQFNQNILAGTDSFQEDTTNFPLQDTVFTDHTPMHVLPGVRGKYRVREPVLRPTMVGQAPTEIDFSSSNRFF